MEGLRQEAGEIDGDSNLVDDESMHIIIWEFIVPEAQLEQFVGAYSSDGEWARLFRRGKGYVGTDLLRASNDSTLFLTVDRWESAACFDRFREDFSDEYQKLDKRLEGLSASERQIGIFSMVNFQGG